MRLTIIGIQGSGKGTQSKLLARKYHLKRIAVGEILRREIGSNSKEGKVLAKYMNKGLMAPNNIVNKIVAKNIPEDNFIIDGFPRDKEQLKAADRDKIDIAILLTIPKREVYRRISLRRKLENRTDDQEKALKERLKLYYKESPYIIQHFKDKIIKINGNRPIKTVFKDIKNALENRHF